MIVHGDKKDPIPVVKSENADSRQQTTTSAQDVINYVSDKKEEIKAHVTQKQVDVLARIDSELHEETKRRLNGCFAGAEWAHQFKSRTTQDNLLEDPKQYLNCAVRAGNVGSVWFPDHSQTSQWITLRRISGYPGVFYNVLSPPMWDYNDGTSPNVKIRVNLDGYIREWSWADLREPYCFAVGCFNNDYSENEDHLSPISLSDVTRQQIGIPFYNFCEVEIFVTKPQTQQKHPDGYWAITQVSYFKEVF